MNTLQESDVEQLLLSMSGDVKWIMPRLEFNLKGSSYLSPVCLLCSTGSIQPMNISNLKTLNFFPFYILLVIGFPMRD
jgi:hypothetical protein